MRIIAGNLKNRKIQAPKGKDIRPTGEKVRESVFNIIYSRFDISKSSVADICCGTGAMGIESISRGASFCTFVDLDTKTVSYNVKNLKIEDGFQIIRGPAQKVKLYNKADIIFVDPPYYQDLVPAILKNFSYIGHQGSFWFVEVESKAELEVDESSFNLIDTRKYGHSKIYILEQLV